MIINCTYLDKINKKILIKDTNKFTISEDPPIFLKDFTEYISSPIYIAVDPELDILYVADQVTNSIFKIDTNTEKIIKKIPLKDTPVSIAVDPKTHKVYGTYDTRNSIYVIKNNTAKNIDFTISRLFLKRLFLKIYYLQTLAH